MNYCKLKSDGRIVDSEDRDLAISVFWLMEVLEVRLEEGVTVESVFRLLRRYPSEFTLALGCPHLGALLDEAGRPSTAPSDLEFLTIRRYVEIDDGNLFFQFDVSGLRREADGRRQQYAIEFCAANDLASLPLRLDPRCFFEEETGLKTTYVGDVKFTLRDVLRALTYELTFA